MNSIWKTLGYWWMIRQFVKRDWGEAWYRYSADERSELSERTDYSEADLADPTYPDLVALHRWTKYSLMGEGLPEKYAPYWDGERWLPGVPCPRCGGEVEAARLVFMIPVCHSCLAPPEPLPIREIGREHGSGGR